MSLCTSCLIKLLISVADFGILKRNVVNINETCFSTSHCYNKLLFPFYERKKLQHGNCNVPMNTDLFGRSGK